MNARGKLTPLPGSPYVAAESRPLFYASPSSSSLAYSRRSKTLYMAGSRTLTRCQVARDGSLTEAGVRQFEDTGGVTAVTVVKRGRNEFLYAPQYDLEVMHGFAVQKDGTLTPLPDFPRDEFTRASSVVSGKRLLFLGNEGNPASVHSFAVDRTGAVTPGGGSPGVVTSPDRIRIGGLALNGRVVFTTDIGQSMMSAFFAHPRTANLAASPSNPIDTGLSDVSGALATSAKRIVFAFSRGGEGVDDAQAFRIEKNLTVTKVGPKQSTGLIGGAAAQAMTSNGKRLVVARGASDALRVFSVRARNAELELVTELELPGANAIGSVLITRR